LLFIESLHRFYYSPLKDNRQVDDPGGERPYQRVDSLAWSAEELAHGKRVNVKGFPKEHKVRLPGGGVYPSHGLCRHKRPDSGFHRGHPKGAWLPLED